MYLSAAPFWWRILLCIIYYHSPAGFTWCLSLWDIYWSPSRGCSVSCCVHYSPFNFALCAAPPRIGLRLKVRWRLFRQPQPWRSSTRCRAWWSRPSGRLSCKVCELPPSKQSTVDGMRVRSVFKNLGRLGSLGRCSAFSPICVCVCYCGKLVSRWDPAVLVLRTEPAQLCAVPSVLVAIQVSCISTSSTACLY